MSLTVAHTRAALRSTTSALSRPINEQYLANKESTMKRKLFTFTVDVTVPGKMTERTARREIRTLINYQSNWSSNVEPGDVRAVKVARVRVVPHQA